MFLFHSGRTTTRVKTSGQPVPADDDNRQMDEATASMAIAISKGLTPWKVGSSETVKVW